MVTKQRFSRPQAAFLSSLVLVGFVCGLVLMVNMNPTQILESVGERGWKNIALADGPHAAGTCAFLYFMAYPHAAVPGTTYASNLSNASAYEFSDTLNGEMTGETPYSTAFDFVVKFVVNQTIGYNVSGSKWEDSWVRANLTCDFEYAADIGPLAAMTIIQIANNTDYAWYHGYINNGGAGYQITKNEKYNCTAITIQGWY